MNPSSSEPVPPAVLGQSQHDWFAREVHPHDGQLKAWLRGNFPSVRDLDDLVQESYLRVWKARAAQPIQSAKAFLFKVARHMALDLIRRDRRSPIDRVRDLADLNVLEDGPSADDAAVLQEKIDLLAAALTALPVRRREVVILRKLKRLSQAEVAAQLGVTERTVENLHARGIAQLESFLRAHGVHGFKRDETK